MITDEELKDLFAEFPKGDVHWRAQTLTKDGTKAMALAYIDARDVMDRLDAICGAGNWQDSYTETQTGRVICTISININGEWISKSDGAGATGMEGEKGGISDAFKRAAVKWGIGRYLYDCETPWVPCESYERNGKKVWSRWKADPWSCLKSAPRASSSLMKKGLDEIENDLLDCDSKSKFDTLVDDWRVKMDEENWSEDFRNIARQKCSAKLNSLKEAA